MPCREPKDVLCKICFLFAVHNMLRKLHSRCRNIDKKTDGTYA